IVLASIFGKSDFFGLTVLWSIYMAFKYARLWSEGYDWRDVFRQQRERELIDVADEVVDFSRALFNRDRRRELRERARAKRLSRGSGAMAQIGAGHDFAGSARGASVDMRNMVDAAGTH